MTFRQWRPGEPGAYLDPRSPYYRGPSYRGPYIDAPWWRDLPGALRDEIEHRSRRDQASSDPGILGGLTGFLNGPGADQRPELSHRGILGFMVPAGADEDGARAGNPDVSRDRQWTDADLAGLDDEHRKLALAGPDDSLLGDDDEAPAESPAMQRNIEEIWATLGVSETPEERAFWSAAPRRGQASSQAQMDSSAGLTPQHGRHPYASYVTREPEPSPAQRMAEGLYSEAQKVSAGHRPSGMMPRDIGYPGYAENNYLSDTSRSGSDIDRLDPAGWSQPVDRWGDAIRFMGRKLPMAGSDWWSRNPEQAYPTNPNPIPRNPSTTIYVSERYPGEPQTDEDRKFRVQALDRNRAFEEIVIRSDDDGIRKLALDDYFKKLRMGATRFDAQGKALDTVKFWKNRGGAVGEEKSALGAITERAQEDTWDRESVINSTINSPKKSSEPSGRRPSFGGSRK